MVSDVLRQDARLNFRQRKDVTAVIRQYCVSCCPTTHVVVLMTLVTLVTAPQGITHSHLQSIVVRPVFEFLLGFFGVQHDVSAVSLPFSWEFQDP